MTKAAKVNKAAWAVDRIKQILEDETVYQTDMLKIGGIHEVCERDYEFIKWPDDCVEVREKQPQERRGGRVAEGVSLEN